MGQGSSSTSTPGFSVESLVLQIQNGGYKNIVVLCGAGISTNAGIPDFRSPSFGLYFKLRKFNLPYPHAVFEGSYFNQDPGPFYGLVREIYPSRLVPTDTHKFFTLLHKKGILRRVFTQNIDALEYLGGLPEDLVVEAHGSFRRSYCIKCKETYELPWLKDELFHPERNNGVPKCEACGGVVRPDVVLFGEKMPSRFCNLAPSDLKNADLLLIFGTSLAVAPFNGLVTLTKSQIPRVYVSKTKPGRSSSALGSFMGLNSSIKFEKSNDLVIIDDCDQVVRDLCGKLNWTQELNKVYVNAME